MIDLCIFIIFLSDLCVKKPPIAFPIEEFSSAEAFFVVVEGFALICVALIIEFFPGFDRVLDLFQHREDAESAVRMSELEYGVRS